MKNNSKYWIVTDLDGTLMDEYYDISPAKKTLKMLAEMNIPVIPCTSKTASEVRYFRKENSLTDPFIVENGAAIYGCYELNSSEWELILGKSYAELKVILFNHSNKEFIVNNNDRIAQIVLVPVIKVEFEEVETLPKTFRGSGGFGSTGK